MLSAKKDGTIPALAQDKKLGIMTWEGFQEAMQESFKSIPPMPILGDPIISDFDRRALKSFSDGSNDDRIASSHHCKEEADLIGGGR